MGARTAGGRGAGPAAGGAAIRPNRAHLAALAAALLPAAAVGARTAALPADRGHEAIVAAAAVAWATLGGAILARSEAGVVWAVAAAGCAYAAALALGPRAVDGWAPVVAAGLVVSAELGEWAVELARPTAMAPGIVRRRAATVGALGVCGAAAGWLMLLAAGAASGGLAIVAAGLAAAAGAIVLVSRLAPRA